MKRAKFFMIDFSSMTKNKKRLRRENMINFIIYEDNKEWQEYYRKAVLKVIGHKQDKYQILVLERWNKEAERKLNNLLGKNVFLLDMEVPGKSGLDLARQIRNTGDWESQMIMITSHECFKEEGFTSKILMLDFIMKKDIEHIAEKINDAIVMALHIHSRHKQFKFIFNNELFQIPYKDILCFEKDLNHNYTTIITKKKPYKIKQSITKIGTELLSIPYFFKTHQSCIVNLENIEKVDFTNNFIYFKNYQTDLLSRAKKKELKDKITKGYDYDLE